ncbi:MAG: FecR domain-containing protein [SAR324 cluster bacterium]|nr:FecR domain-containing protein [SAR324 cluster bacterium]
MKHLIIPVLIWLVAPLLYAQDGVLILLKGYLQHTHAGSDQVYRVGDDSPSVEVRVFEGDEIQTGENTEVELKLRQDSEKMTLYANTYLKISRIDEQETLLNLWIGKAKFLVESVVDQFSGIMRFKVQTGVAFLGVKGTEFFVETNKTGTSLLTLSGVVLFANRTNLEDLVEVTQNHVSKVIQNRPPTPPGKISDARKERILNGDSKSWGSAVQETERMDQGLKDSSQETLEALQEDQTLELELLKEKQVKIQVEFQ